MSNQQTRGRLIAIEGIDGSGKSSAAKALYAALTAKFPGKVLLTKEPGATQLGKELRAVLQQRTFELDSKAEYLLFAADRAQHFAQIIIPELDKGTFIISDRLADSSLAYQGYGRGLDKQWIKDINSWAMNGCKPDLTIYLKIDYETALERLQKRNELATVFESEKADFFQRIIGGFEEMYAGRADVITINAHAEPEIVFRDLIDKVSQIMSMPNYSHSYSFLANGKG